MRVDGVLLDLDGTLADTLPDLAGALNEVLSGAGRRPVSTEALRSLVSRGSRAMVEHALADEADPGELEEVHARFLDLYASNLTRRTTLYPGMHEVLEELENRGLPWGLVTNKLARFTDPLVAGLGLAERAACVVSGDTTAEAKPHPAPLLHACESLGCRPAHAVYVGDARKDAVAGRRAGVRVLVALWGYLDPRDPPQRWGADDLLETPGALVEWLDREA